MNIAKHKCMYYLFMKKEIVKFQYIIKSIALFNTFLLILIK